MEWKQIKGYEELYEVSDAGLVRSVNKKRWEGKILTLNAYGPKRNYHQIELWKAGKRKKYKLHQLVAKHFIPNPNNYSLVMHLDNNPTNNLFTNLQWGTHSHNMQQCVSEGRNRNQYN